MQVSLETAFIERDIRDISNAIYITRRHGGNSGQSALDFIRPKFAMVEVNQHATRAGVKGDVYDGYRKGNVGACADIVLVSGDGRKPSVPMIYRARPPFGKTWWIMGGAVHNFRAVHHYLLYKALCEGGIIQVPEEIRKDSEKSATWFYDNHPIADNQWSLGGITVVGMIGFYRTPAEDLFDGRVCDTIQPCYLGLLEPSVKVWHDKDHDAVRNFQLEELDSTDMHPYPRQVAETALKAYHDAL